MRRSPRRVPGWSMFFARQKGPMGLVVRTISLARARMKVGLANLVYNMRRMVWLAGAASA
jgi:IS5 family transposase